ncbi:MAG: transposase [Myxococcales bacterium]
MVKNGCCVGIDVSKKWLDCAVWPSGENFTEANSPAGITRVAERVRKLVPKLVAAEATGGLELPVITALANAAHEVAIVNPRRVREFAKALGYDAKTDAIDAGVIAHYAEVASPIRYCPPSPERMLLETFLTRRRQLIALATAERGRLSAMPAEAVDVRAMTERHLAWLVEERTKLDALLLAQTRQSEEQLARYQLLCSVPGVGPVTAATLIASLPELGRINRKQNRSTRWCGSLQPRHRTPGLRCPHCLGWPRRRPYDALHGRARRKQEQPSTQSHLRETRCQGQAQEGRPDGVHSQAAADPQPDRQVRSAMAVIPTSEGGPLKLLPPAQRLSRSPQLAALAILEAALGPCEEALLAAHDELAYGAAVVCERGPDAMRAHSVLVASRRLGAALAAYHEALGRSERKRLRERYRDIPF